MCVCACGVCAGNHSRRFKFVMNESTMKWGMGFLRELDKSAKYCEKFNLVQASSPLLSFLHCLLFLFLSHTLSQTSPSTCSLWSFLSPSFFVCFWSLDSAKTCLSYTRTVSPACSLTCCVSLTRVFSVSQVGHGSNTCLVSLRQDFNKLNVDTLTYQFRRASHRIIITDYDGTLTSETDSKVASSCLSSHVCLVISACACVWCMWVCVGARTFVFVNISLFDPVSFFVCSPVAGVAFLLPQVTARVFRCVRRARRCCSTCAC